MYRRRTICDPVSPALSRVSAFSRLFISGGIAAGLHHIERIQEAVVEDLGLVDVVRAQQMVRAAADVGDIDDGVAAISRWMSNAHWCVRRRLQVGIDHGIGAARKGRRSRQAGWGGAGDSARADCARRPPPWPKVGIDRGERGARQVRQNLRGDHEGVGAVVGEPVVAANRGLAGAERIPRETDRGSEIAELVLEQIAGNPVAR